MGLLDLCGNDMPKAAQEKLLSTLFASHEEAAVAQQNISMVSVALSAQGGGDFTKAMANGILTLGGAHGPTTRAREVIYQMGWTELAGKIKDGLIVPGYGNSFHKDGIDPAFEPLRKLLEDAYADHYKKLSETTEFVRKQTGKNLHPNPAAFTAVCAEILGVPYGVELLLVLMARLPAWTLVFLAQPKADIL